MTAPHRCDRDGHLYLYDPAYPAGDKVCSACGDRPNPAPGRKDDQSKTPFHLLPWRALTEVVKVLAHGEKKYGAWNWIKVEPHRERYFAAAIRHLTAWWNGEIIDPESGFHHLAHAICCCLFLIGREIGDTGPAPATRRFVRGNDPTNETCLTCGKPIGHHFGGIEYRCDPKVNS